MKFINIILITLLFNFSYADDIYEDWDKEAFTKPVLVQKGTHKHWCSICGMSIKKFYKTSHIATLKDGKTQQYCSMRCLVVHNKSQQLNNIKAIDNKTEKLIDATKAFYVVDSDISGTMSKISKLPFENKKDALEFIKEYDGKIKSYKEAIKIANDGLKNDIAMIQNKKIKKIYPMGKKLYTKFCKKDINLNNFKQINQLKAYIKSNNLCKIKTKDFNPKQLQVVSLYLWDIVRVGKKDKNSKTINITKDEKCPICGMFVYKYPRWVAQIHIDNKTHLSFDGVKDMMKYYIATPKASKILVTDYYLQKAIDGTKAFYVINSDIYGPMGKELIPFSTKKEALTFMQDHKGKKILSFKQITKEEIGKLD